VKGQTPSLVLGSQRAFFQAFASELGLQAPSPIAFTLEGLPLILAPYIGPLQVAQKDLAGRRVKLSPTAKAMAQSVYFALCSLRLTSVYAAPRRLMVRFTSTWLSACLSTVKG
jgi:hypothetical protein